MWVDDENAWFAFKRQVMEVMEMTKEELLSLKDTGDYPSDWAREATQWAKQTGVFTGDSAGNFGWQQPVTREAVAKLLQLYESMKPKKTGVSPLASIAATAKVGDNCYIAPFACIGENAVVGDNCQLYPHVTVGDGAKVGDNCLFYPNVTIYHGCKIGNNVTIHAGSVIGADGFGFAPNADGYDKIPQIGIVTIEDNVEIGANTCVDRSTMGSTYLRKGVKLDNLVQIAHNTDIGENTVMSAQVGIAGSTKVGAWCMFGGQVGLAGHIKIGDKVFLGAQSGVPGSIKDNQTLIGTPPMEPKKYFKSQAIFRRLPDMYAQLNELQKQIDELKKQNEQ